MKSIEKFVEAKLNLISAESELVNELCMTFGIGPGKVKSISLKNRPSDTSIVQIVTVKLTGNNRIRSEDMQKVDGMTVVTPNTIEFEVGEIHL